MIVLGGLHASMNYREAVRHCDYVLLGEGDETILLFLQALKGEIPMDFAGLAYQKEGKLVCTGYPLLRRPLKPLLTEIWSIAIRKWPDIIRYGLRPMLPEAALITAITALWYAILAIGCAPEHRKT